MESNTNNISSAGLHGLDQRQYHSWTSEEVDVRQGQNALGSLLLSTGLTPSAIVARHLNFLTPGWIRTLVTDVFSSNAITQQFLLQFVEID